MSEWLEFPKHKPRKERPYIVAYRKGRFGQLTAFSIRLWTGQSFLGIKDENVAAFMSFPLRRENPIPSTSCKKAFKTPKCAHKF